MYSNKHKGYNTSSGLNDICGLTQYEKQDALPLEKPLYENKAMVHTVLDLMRDEDAKPEKPDTKTSNSLKIVDTKDAPFVMNLDRKTDTDDEDEEDDSMKDPNLFQKADVLKSKYSVEAQKLNKLVGRSLPKERKKKRYRTIINVTE
jgi:hypothetical protein